MVLPLSHPVQDYAGPQGAWRPLQDAEGRALYRQVLSPAN